jgi:uncharacterized damage-inducible protein DinB
VTREDLELLFDYSYWATRRVLAAAAQVSLEQLAAESTASHGSLRRTLVHALSAEYAWRIMCEHGIEVDALSERDLGTVAAIAARWREEEAAMRAYLAGLTQPGLLRVVSYTNREGEPRHRVLWHCLFHVVNHSTHTRAQAVSMLRAVGRSAGDLDFTWYLGEGEAG